MLAHVLLALLPALALAAPAPAAAAAEHQPWQPPAPAHAPVAPSPAAHQPWQPAPAPVAPAAEWPKHGSGSQPIGDLNSCLQMCQTTFGGQPKEGAPPAGGAAPSPPPPPPTPVQGGNGAKATHTVIVAPSQGVLRFVPFSITANDGDMLKFVWGAGPHSATLSSGNNACSAAQSGFESGNLNATATFEAVVNGTTPKFHYCKVGQHCANGMFGIVNPPTTNVTAGTPTVSRSAPGEGSTAGAGSTGCNPARMDCWVANWSNSAPEASATVAAVQKACERSNTRAWQWGAAIDMSGLLGDGVTQQNVVENVLYTRLMMSMNPSMLEPNAPVDTSASASASASASSSAASPAESAAPVDATNWVVPPNLADFVAQSNEGGAGAGSGGSADAVGAYGEPVPAPADDAAAASASASASASAGQDATSAGASTSSAGTGAKMSPLALLLAVGVASAFVL